MNKLREKEIIPEKEVSPKPELTLVSKAQDKPKGKSAFVEIMKNFCDELDNEINAILDL